MKVRKPITHDDANNHREFFQELAKAVNGKISFGSQGQGEIVSDNIDGVWDSLTTPVAPNTEFAVTHNLNRIPVGYDLKRKDKAASVYDGVTVWTNTQIFLKCDTASVAITLFIH